MQTDDDFEIYINRCKQFIEVMINTKQWSGLTKNDVHRWVSNFKNLSPNQLYIVYKLLTNIVYYSNDDIVFLLKDGIRNRLFNGIILNNQIGSDFHLDDTQITDIINAEMKCTCFIPLLDTNSPHESGNYISRLLVQNNIIDKCQSIFLSGVKDAITNFNYKRIVIVDDCVGSGDQLNEFWNSKATIDNTNTLLKEWAKVENIEVNYLVLVGYKKTMVELSNNLPKINFYCLRELDDDLRVFNDKSYIWEDTNEKNLALSLFDTIAVNNDIALYGYKLLDFAFIMDKTIPDWSLPIFWKNNKNWNNLMTRKDSNV
jgi:hypothetical protein